MSKIMSKSCKKFPYWMFGTLFFLILLGLVFGIYNVRESFTEGSCSRLEVNHTNAIKASNDAFSKYNRKIIQVQIMKQRIARERHQLWPHVIQLRKLSKTFQENKANQNQIKKQLDECIINTTPVSTQAPNPEYEECNSSFDGIGSCDSKKNDKTKCEKSYENTESGIGQYCTFTPGGSSFKPQAEAYPGKTGYKTGYDCNKANSGGRAKMKLRAGDIGAAGPYNNDGKQILSLSHNQILEKCKKVAEGDYGKTGYSGISVSSTGPWHSRGCDIFYQQHKLLETIPADPADGMSCYVNPDYEIKVDSNPKCRPSDNMCNTAPAPTPSPSPSSCSSLEESHIRAISASDNALKQFNQKKSQVKRMRQNIKKLQRDLRSHVKELNELRKTFREKKANQNQIKKQLDECIKNN